MNEQDAVRKKLKKELGQEIPDAVWTSEHVKDVTKDYLKEGRDEDWSLLVEEVVERIAIWNASREDFRRSSQASRRSPSAKMLAAQARDRSGSPQVDFETSSRVKAMQETMSALFASLASQIPGVRSFRKDVLVRGFLTSEEVHALISSVAARTLSRAQFEKLSISPASHESEILGLDQRGPAFDPRDHTMRLRIGPRDEEIGSHDKEKVQVRYALSDSGDPFTRCVVQDRTVVPIHTDLPIEAHDRFIYPSWLWPGSVVDELYELSVELAEAFDYPLAVFGTRPRSESAALFILTDETPMVEPIEARWESNQSIPGLLPQWRMHLKIPYWFPESETVELIRILKRQMNSGKKLPKESTVLDVARFVWDRERFEDHKDRRSWREWCELWNEEHPARRFGSAPHFRTYFLRGAAAVQDLNFSAPQNN